MTGEITHEEDGFLSAFNNSQRRNRRNGLCDIFQGVLEGEEIISFQNRMLASSPEITDENGELVVLINALDTSSTYSNCSTKDADSPGQTNSNETDRLSGLGLPEESSSTPSVETARPSCLVGLKSTTSNSSSSISTSPSSMSSQSSSSSDSSSNSSSSLSRGGDSKVQVCSPDDNTTTTTPSSSTTQQHGFTTSPSTSSLCYDSFSRVRRNALHDLFETLTQDDLEKLKNLYQTALSTAYALKPFSEQTQSPIRGYHECKA